MSLFLCFFEKRKSEILTLHLIPLLLTNPFVITIQCTLNKSLSGNNERRFSTFIKFISPHPPTPPLHPRLAINKQKHAQNSARGPQLIALSARIIGSSQSRDNKNALSHATQHATRDTRHAPPRPNSTLSPRPDH